MKSDIIKLLLLLYFILFSTACSTVSILKSDENVFQQKPTYQKSMPYYLFGVIGEHHINIDDICSGSSALAIQSQDTFKDRVLTYSTLGLYKPRTAKIWCEIEKN